jgi:hypothetical protein
MKHGLCHIIIHTMSHHHTTMVTSSELQMEHGLYREHFEKRPSILTNQSMKRGVCHIIIHTMSHDPSESCVMVRHGSAARRAWQSQAKRERAGWSSPAVAWETGMFDDVTWYVWWCDHMMWCKWDRYVWWCDMVCMMMWHGMYEDVTIWCDYRALSDCCVRDRFIMRLRFRV